MSYPILILGASGSGKSTSIRGLDPKKTFLFNVCNKNLPFKGSKKLYIEATKENPSGNKMTTDNYNIIGEMCDRIDKNRKEINHIVIDDSQYLIVNEFMKNHSVTGKGNDVFSLYNRIADEFWKLMWNSKLYREDLFIFFLHHIEITEAGMVKAKTIGKLLDDKIDIPGIFEIVLFARREGTENWFYTQNDGSHPAKSPDGMFDKEKIPNDLSLVVSKIKPYFDGE